MKVISGKKALVTGAASGIGRAIALALAREGAELYLLDIDAERLAKVVGEVKQDGGSALGYTCDVASAEENSAAIHHVLGHAGHIDILVNNAGVVYYGPTERMTTCQWDRLLAINLHAPIQFTRELLPTLLARPEAHIVNVCSIAGLVAGSKLAAYQVSKFGLVGFSEAIRAEYVRKGLGVTALCPGAVQTNILQSAMNGQGRKPIPFVPLWLTTTPNVVADRTIRAIRRNQALAILTPLAHLLWFVKRLSPALWAYFVGTARRKKQRTSVPTFSPHPQLDCACHPSIQSEG